METSILGLKQILVKLGRKFTTESSSGKDFPSQLCMHGMYCPTVANVLVDDKVDTMCIYIKTSR